MFTARIGLLYVLSVPIGAGLSGVEGWMIAGFHYTGWLWIAYLLAGVLVVGIEKAVHKQSPTPFPYWRWGLWFGFLWLSLGWCTGGLARGVQDALQISLPLLVGIASSLFVRTPRQFHALVTSVAIAVLLILITLTAGFTGLVSLEPRPPVIGVALRVSSIAITMAAAVALAALPKHRLAAIAAWASCLLVTVLTGSRMATLATLALPMFHPRIGRLRWRAVAALVIAGLAVAAFYTPVLQERFFHSGSGTLEDVWEGRFDDAGRFYAWERILPEIAEQPWLGHGVGTIHDFVPTVWPLMVHIHNDYLRIAYEVGGIGLSLFLVVHLWQYTDLWRFASLCQGTTRWAFTAALLGFTAFLVTAVTDNSLMYNLWLTNPLFAMMGAGYGQLDEQARRSSIALQSA
jgi:O-antigen ligase